MKHVAQKMQLVTVSESSDVYIINFGQLQLQNAVVSIKMQKWLFFLIILEQAIFLFSK